MRDLEQPLAAVKGRWMTGLPGADAAPDIWRDLIGDGPEAELRLLALAGQAVETGWVPAPRKLTLMPPLPALALPAMPDPARVRFRRILEQEKPNTEDLAPVLHLCAARGYAVHPEDWMPPASDTAAPTLYAPWIDWLNTDGTRGEEGDALNADTWDRFLPAERRAGLTALRLTDPEAMRSLLIEKAGETPAEERLRLVALLGDGLDKADIPYLESLETDRSGKVKVLAAQFLARLGEIRSDSELVTELADTLEMARIRTLGLAKGLGPKKLKNDAQRKRRIELFALVSLHDVAAAFDLSPEDAVTGWRIGAHKPTTDAFAAMTAATGPDAVQVPLAERLIAEGHLDAVAHLVPRLSPEERSTLATAALGLEGDRFRLARDLFTADLGTVPLKALIEMPDFKALEADLVTAKAESDKYLAALKAGIEAKEEKRSWQAEAKVADTMRTLGLLATRDSAAALIDRFTALGLIPADPRLAMLYLNAELTPRSTR